jgi:hypothetical protein
MTKKRSILLFSGGLNAYFLGKSHAAPTCKDIWVFCTHLSTIAVKLLADPAVKKEKDPLPGNILTFMHAPACPEFKSDHAGKMTKYGSMPELS